MLMNEIEKQSISEKEQRITLDTSDTNETLMMVDDEQDLLATGKRYLQRHGYRVITAENGWEAINKYKELMIDMVVLDVGLPDMNGLKCLETLKSIDQNAKIIVSSGSYAAGDEKEVLDLGAEALLSKPYRLNELLNATRKILNRQSV